MKADLVRKETPDESWRHGLLLSPPRKTPRSIQSAPPRLRVHVRFAPDSQLTQEHFIYSVPFSETDREELWYTKEEYALMKRSSSFTVRLMMELYRNDQSFDVRDEELCTRGLEAKTRKGARRRRQNIEQAVDAVLGEQERRSHMNYLFDSYLLARTYHDLSARCSMEAWIAAQKDAEIVESLWSV